MAAHDELAELIAQRVEEEGVARCSTRWGNVAFARSPEDAARVTDMPVFTMEEAEKIYANSGWESPNWRAFIQVKEARMRARAQARPQVKTCPACGGSRFWTNPSGVRTCSQCHPSPTE